MQTSHAGRVLAAFLLVALTSCSRTSDNPYAALKNPPLLKAELHTVTLATDGAAVAEGLQVKGYVPIQFSSNYPVSNAVEASLWSVPEQVAVRAAHYKALGPAEPDVRVLKMALAANSRPADSAVETAFFKNVLGVDVPQWPAGVAHTDKVRVQVWTYVVPDVMAANKHLRESGIPVVYDPVGITTAYLGDHKAMAIRAPDGTIVELVETAAQ